MFILKYGVSFSLTKICIFCRAAAFNVHQYAALDLTNYMLAFGNVFVGKVRDLNQFFWQVSTVKEIHSRFSCLHCRHKNRRMLQYSVFSVQWTDIPIIYYNLKHEQLRAHSHSTFRSIVARALHITNRTCLKNENGFFMWRFFVLLLSKRQSVCVHNTLFLFSFALSVRFFSLAFSERVAFVDFSKVHSNFIRYFMCEMQSCDPFCSECWLVNKYGYPDVTDITISLHCIA